MSSRPRLSLLSGGRVVARLPESEPQPKPEDPREKALEAAVDYLRTDAAERARREAEPILEAERKKMQAELDQIRLTARKETENAAARLQKTESELTKLRANYGENMDQYAALQRELDERTTALQAAQDKAAAAERQAMEQIQELNAKLAAIPPAPAAPVKEPPLRADQIEMNWNRDGAGLIHSVVLKAAGYDDVTVNVERFPDNRIRALNVKGEGNE